jgi:hypothetical protein
MLASAIGGSSENKLIRLGHRYTESAQLLGPTSREKEKRISVQRESNSGRGRGGWQVRC